MTVAEFIDELKHYNPNATLRFSVADDESKDAGERWFVENGIEECIGDESEVTVCLLGRSNLG